MFNFVPSLFAIFPIALILITSHWKLIDLTPNEVISIIVILGLIAIFIQNLFGQYKAKQIKSNGHPTFNQRIPYFDRTYIQNSLLFLPLLLIAMEDNIYFYLVVLVFPLLHGSLNWLLRRKTDTQILSITNKRIINVGHKIKTMDLDDIVYLSIQKNKLIITGRFFKEWVFNLKDIEDGDHFTQLLSQRVGTTVQRD